MAITEKQKQQIAYCLLDQPFKPHHVGKTGINDSHLCDFYVMGRRTACLAVKCVDTGQKRPCIAFWFNERKQEFLDKLKGLQLPQKFYLDETNVTSSGSGWVSFCREDCASAAEMYRHIIDPGDQRESWISLRDTLVDWVKGLPDGKVVFFEEETGGHLLKEGDPAIVQVDTIKWPQSAVMPRAIELITQQDYASVYNLCRRLSEDGVGINEEELYHELKNECVSANSIIGEIDEESARRAILQSKVFYSKAWAADIPWPEDIGLKVGLHLYRRILDNHWNNYRGNGLSFHLLKDNNFDNVIANGMLWEGRGYLWNDFSKLYEGLAEHDKKKKGCQVVALQGTAGNVKRLQKELLDCLANSLLGEKFSDDVTADNGVIVQRNKKITRPILKTIVGAICSRSIQSNDERLTRLINEFLPRFEALGQ